MTDKKLEVVTDAEYKPSLGELNNLAYLVFKYGVGWGMRQADLSVCLMMVGGAEAVKGDEGLSKFVYTVCEYAWDHIAGEPEEFDADKLFDHMKPALQEWYKNTTPEQRADIG
jgi:hypothetical protein